MISTMHTSVSSSEPSDFDLSEPPALPSHLCQAISPVYLLLESFLPATVFFVLRRVNSSWRGLAEASRKRRVADALVLAGHTEVFRDALWESNSLLSGSFVLWVLLDQPASWSPGDLDIYRPALVDSDSDMNFSPIEDLCWRRAARRDAHFSYDNYLADLVIIRTYNVGRSRNRAREKLLGSKSSRQRCVGCISSTR